MKSSEKGTGKVSYVYHVSNSKLKLMYLFTISLKVTEVHKQPVTHEIQTG